MNLRPLFTRLANVVSRAIIRRVDDSQTMQTVQVDVLADETRDGVERVQQYGFTSVPLAGAEAVAVFVGGFRDHGLIVAVDDRRYRLTSLEPGEVALYTDQGDKVVIERGGTIRVTASTKVVVAAPLVELAGNAKSVAKGEDLNTAIRTLGTAIATAVSGIPAGGAAAGAAITAAVATFNASATAALSTKVKLE